MKIVFCTPGSVEFEDYEGGKILGTEYQVFNLAKALKKQGHEVIIIRRWYSNKPKEETIEDIRILNVMSPSLMDTLFQNILSKIYLSLKVRKEICLQQPDILVLTEIFSSFFVSSLKIPKFFVTHNPPTDIAPDILFIKRLIKKSAEKIVFSRCKKIVALNNTINDYLIKCHYPSVTIPNGIDINNYCNSDYDGNYILYGGRLTKLKGIHHLIEAYSILNSEIKNKYKLVIVGEGPERKSLESQIHRFQLNEHVELIPWLFSKDFIKKISNCTIFVFPSLHETFGIVLLEAMALGKPIIASDIPGPQDIINNEVDGLLFEKGNVKQLHNKLQALCEDIELRKKIGKNARIEIECNYNFDIIGEKYYQLFLEATS